MKTLIKSFCLYKVIGDIEYSFQELHLLHQLKIIKKKHSEPNADSEMLFIGHTIQFICQCFLQANFALLFDTNALSDNRHDNTKKSNLQKNPQKWFAYQI